MATHSTSDKCNHNIHSKVEKDSMRERYADRSSLFYRQRSANGSLRIPTMTRKAPSNARDNSIGDLPRQRRPSLDGAISSLPGASDVLFSNDRPIRPERIGNSGVEKKRANQPQRNDTGDDLNNPTVTASATEGSVLPGMVCRTAISRRAEVNCKSPFNRDLAQTTPVDHFSNRIHSIPPVSRSGSRWKADPDGRRIEIEGESRWKADPDRRRSDGSRSNTSCASAGRRRRVTSAKSEGPHIMINEPEAQLPRSNLVIRIPGLVDSGTSVGSKFNGCSDTTGAWDNTDTWISIRNRSERWLQKWSNTSRPKDNRNPYTPKITSELTVKAHGCSQSDFQRNLVEQTRSGMEDNGRQTKTAFQGSETPCHDDDSKTRSASGSPSVSDSHPACLETICLEAFNPPAKSFRFQPSDQSKNMNREDKERVSSTGRDSSVLPFASDEAWKVIEHLRLEKLKEQQQEQTDLSRLDHDAKQREPHEKESERIQQEQVHEHEYEAAEHTKKQTRESHEGLPDLLIDHATHENQTISLETKQTDLETSNAVLSNSTTEAKSIKTALMTKSSPNLIHHNSTSNDERLQKISCRKDSGFGRRMRRNETSFAINLVEGHPRAPVAPPTLVNREPRQRIKSRSAGTLRTPQNNYGDGENRNSWIKGKCDWNVRDKDGANPGGSFRMTPFQYDSRYLDYLERSSLEDASRGKRDADCGYEDAIAEAVIKCTAWLNGQDMQNVDLTHFRCLRGLT